MGNPAQRQRRIAAKAARRKAVVAGKKKSPISSYDVAGGVRLASRGAIARCVISSVMFEHGIGYVAIARELPKGMLGCGFFLIDTFFRGVKDVFVREMSQGDLKDYIDAADAVSSFVDVAPAYARKLINDAIAYADRLGISPAKDADLVEGIFGEIDAADCTETFTFGKYGAPLYMAGPNDALADLGAVIRALEDHLPLDESDYMEAESENAAD
jgi:hypothetical protein